MPKELGSNCVIRVGQILIKFKLIKTENFEKFITLAVEVYHSVVNEQKFSLLERVRAEQFRAEPFSSGQFFEHARAMFERAMYH